MSTSLDGTAVEEIARLAQAAAQPSTVVSDGLEFLVTETGLTLIPRVNGVLPDHVRQTVQFDDAASLVAYVNAFKTPDTRLFASLADLRVTAEFDYHRPPAPLPQQPAETMPAMMNQRGHRATWTMPLSEPWKRWTGIDGQALSQWKFAEFLEENLADIVEPAGATLLEAATDLQARKKVEFHSGVRLATGAVQFTFNEETVTNGARSSVSVPTELVIGIPVFLGGVAYKVRCFLRWRLNDERKLLFTVVMNRRQVILLDAASEAANAVAAGTGIPVLYGKPDPVK